MILNVNTDKAYQLLHDGTLALCNAEQAGIRIDLDYVRRKIPFVERKMNRYEAKFRETDFFADWQRHFKNKVNINSDPQLKTYLYKILKHTPPKLTTTDEGSTDEESLRELNIPALDLLLEKKRFKKAWDVISRFEKESVDGYIHPFFNLFLVQTFRSSSSSPNFQNIPKRDEEMMQICRQALYPRPGHQFLEIDYSGLEVRIAACYHKDPTMLKYINDPTTDMHRDMAKQLFCIDDFKSDVPWHKYLRSAAKNGFVFPEFYGDYWKNCASGLACRWGKLPKSHWSRGQGHALDTSNFTLGDHLIAKGFNSLERYEGHVKKIERDFWTRRFRVYAKWKETWWAEYVKNGYVDMLTGFRCNGLMNRKQVINYPVQGAAFHCLLWSFIELDRAREKFGWDTRLVGQIHDSIILDVNPKELNKVAAVANRITTERLAKHWKWIIVPLEVEMELCPVDGSWAEKSAFHLK